ncbi:MAG TPA: N,N'-diacetylchitobiose phosphorylase [Fibrobacteria bacterium]|nr:N,N'-diacetylchitobiose phosphorylase [Fibrobacteria bacterium]
MRYGHFDDLAREYVITRPDTPKSWINYLGSRLYGGIITQNAGGYSFYKSGGTGRILRMHFNSVPVDQPGRTIYVRDDHSGDFWSTSWQPVGKPLDKYKSRVRYGLGYSVFESEYDGIATILTVFVPKGQAFEYWALRVVNRSNRHRKLSIISYAELANNWNYRQDLENLQYSQYTVQMSVHDGMIRWRNCTNPGYDEVWFGLAGAPVVGFDTDREQFLGPYRTFAAPAAVEKGRLGHSIAVGDNGCASLQANIELETGESRDLTFMLGMGSPIESWRGLPPGADILEEFGTPQRLEKELAATKAEWTEVLERLQVETPDTELNSMLNVWHAYQTHMTFNWSRGVSLVEAGDRDGLGYRDTVQDILAVTHAIPAQVEERLDLILTGQTSAGGGLPLVKPLSHSPGHEKPPADEQYRSDDTLWLPFTVSNFVYETGRLDYLDKILPYADKGEASVYGHLKQALQFSIDHKGRNGLVQGLHADWNDCIKFGTTGESLFTSFMFLKGCRIVADLARRLGREEDAQWAESEAAEMHKSIQASAWDGNWFLRAISATGGTLGSHRNPEGSIYLNAQTWAVISGAASASQARIAMDSVKRHLATEHGLLLCDPPHTHPDPHIQLPLLVYPPGHKENGGIFCHSNAWAVVAECILGDGDRAHEYYRSYLPARYNEAADIRQVEPYVYCQFTHGKSSPRFGQSRNPWLTGTASWTYIAVTQFMLGVRPEFDGLRIDPCIPRDWKGFSMTRYFRGKKISLWVSNPKGVCRGVGRIILNGERLEGNIIPAALLQDRNIVRVVLDG